MVLLSPEKDKELAGLYLSAERPSIAELCYLFKVSQRGVYQSLDRTNTPLRQQRKRSQIVALFVEHEDLDKVVEVSGKSRQEVRRILISEGFHQLEKLTAKTSQTRAIVMSFPASVSTREVSKQTGLSETTVLHYRRNPLEVTDATANAGAGSADSEAI